VLDDLPPGLSPKLAPIATGLGEIFYYTLDYTAGAKAASPATREASSWRSRQIQNHTS